ncbi:MAG: protein-L-isoaspartate(D-aspartate) O-methyltransferase [Pseudomonadota bacterium]
MDYTLARQKMVENQIKARDIIDQRVIKAMLKIPRHLFVEEALAHRAYGDSPLPIGEQQTISQPYIVAQMTEALELKGSERVLEIGTGSGYQAAILAELCYRVYTIERIRSLMMKARAVLEEMGYHNVFFRLDDGTLGWSEQAPFEAIVVTAGAPEVPAPLMEQLAPGGRLVIPVGKSRQTQSLMKLIKDESGRITSLNLGDCRFVDLVGNHGWSAGGDRS